MGRVSWTKAKHSKDPRRSQVVSDVLMTPEIILRIFLGHREGRAGNRGPRETTYIIQDTRSPEGGPGRAPEMPRRGREAAPPTSAG